MREEEAAWRAAAERLHRQQEEYLQMLEREAALSGLTTEDVEVGRDQKQQTAADRQTAYLDATFQQSKAAQQAKKVHVPKWVREQQKAKEAKSKGGTGAAMG